MRLGTYTYSELQNFAQPLWPNKNICITHTHTYTHSITFVTLYEQQYILCILNGSTEELFFIKYATFARASLPVCQDGVNREVWRGDSKF